MDCYQHPGVAAVGVCVACGRGTCAHCGEEIAGHRMCAPCLAAAQAQLAPPGTAPEERTDPPAPAPPPLAPVAAPAPDPPPTAFPAALEPKPAGFSHYAKASLFGFVGAWVGAWIWAKFVQITSFEFGLVAVFLAVGVSIAVRVGAEGRSGAGLPFLGALCSAFCVLLGYAMMAVDQAAKDGSLARIPWVLQLPIGLLAVVMSGDLWVWVFTGIAGWQGWTALRQRPSAQ